MRAHRHESLPSPRRSRSPEDLPADHEPLDVARAFVDLADAHVAVNALDRKIGDVAIAAVNLKRIGTHALGHLGCEELRHRRFLETGLTRIAQGRRVPYRLARDVHLCR